MIDLDGPDPLYVQLANILRSRIEDGTYPPNRAIPSVAALIEEFSLSTMTVQKSVKVLKDEGRLRAVKGRGTFVVPQED